MTLTPPRLTLNTDSPATQEKTLSYYSAVVNKGKPQKLLEYSPKAKRTFSRSSFISYIWTKQLVLGGGASMFQRSVNWIFVWLDDYQRKKSRVQSSSCVQVDVEGIVLKSVEVTARQRSLKWALAIWEEYWDKHLYLQ